MNKILLPAFIIIISIGVFVYYVNPSYSETKALLDKKSKYDDVMNKSKDLATLRDALLSEYNSLNPRDIDSLNKMIPDNIDNVKIIMDINDIASRYGMTIKDITVDVPTVSDDNTDTSKSQIEEKDYGVVNINFSVETTYKNFVSFIRSLERNNRIVDITGISFKVSDTGLHKYSLTVKTYWLK